MFAALRHLRQPDDERVLWADAVCINQKDIVERGHQVAIMSPVYTSTTEVSVWLGQEPASPLPTTALKRLFDLGKNSPDLEELNAVVRYKLGMQQESAWPNATPQLTPGELTAISPNFESDEPLVAFRLLCILSNDSHIHPITKRVRFYRLKM